MTPSKRPSRKKENSTRVQYDRTGQYEEITRLWNEGYSATEIGGLLVMGRNSVIGVVSRLREKGVALRKNEALAKALGAARALRVPPCHKPRKKPPTVFAGVPLKVKAPKQPKRRSPQQTRLPQSARIAPVQGVFLDKATLRRDRYLKSLTPDNCRWLEGDNAPFEPCKGKGYPYCKAHTLRVRVYARPSLRKTWSY